MGEHDKHVRIQVLITLLQEELHRIQDNDKLMIGVSRMSLSLEQFKEFLRDYRKKEGGNKVPPREEEIRV